MPSLMLGEGAPRSNNALGGKRAYIPTLHTFECRSLIADRCPPFNFRSKTDRTSANGLVHIQTGIISSS